MKDRAGTTLETGDLVECVIRKFSSNTLSIEKFNASVLWLRADKRIVVQTIDGKKRHVKPSQLIKR